MTDTQLPRSLDPQFAELFRAAAAAGMPPLTALTPEQARERIRASHGLMAPGPELPGVRDLTVPGGAGPVPARLYPAPGGQPVATVVYLHGGGWVTGDLDYSDALCRHLAADVGCTVLSVDYRLAPDHPFPAPLDVAWAALRWAAGELAVGTPLVVAGDSAGGALAAACAQRARDLGGPALAAQLLVYPVLDADLDRPSYLGEPAGMGRAEMAWFWDHYLPDVTARTDDRACPLRATDLSGLPPTVLLVADLDPLRDEGLAYAAGLEQAGVPVRLHHLPGLVHGFLRFTTRVDAAAAVIPVITAELRALLAPTPTHPTNEGSE